MDPLLNDCSSKFNVRSTSSGLLQNVLFPKKDVYKDTESSLSLFSRLNQLTVHFITQTAVSLRVQMSFKFKLLFSHSCCETTWLKMAVEWFFCVNMFKSWSTETEKEGKIMEMLQKTVRDNRSKWCDRNEKLRQFQSNLWLLNLNCEGISKVGLWKTI